jgi:LysM repeat protein
MAVLGVIFLAASWQAVASGERDGAGPGNTPAILEEYLAASQRTAQELEALRQELTQAGLPDAAANQQLLSRLELVEKRLAALEQKTAGSGQVKGDTYVVKEGDSLSLIAEKFNIPAGSLRKWNNIGPRGNIRAGQELRLSGG